MAPWLTAPHQHHSQVIGEIRKIRPQLGLSAAVRRYAGFWADISPPTTTWPTVALALERECSVDLQSPQQATSQRVASSGYTLLAAAIKPRWSATTRTRYLSNGCEHCDALQGDFLVGEEASALLSKGGVDALDTLLVTEVATSVWQRVVHGERGDGGSPLM